MVSRMDDPPRSPSICPKSTSLSFLPSRTAERVALIYNVSSFQKI
jgi:hypothetical protein